MKLKSMWVSVGAILAMSGAAWAQPANDDCSAAIDLTSETFPLETSPADVLLANPSVEAAMCVGAGYSVWYKITPTLSGLLNLQTCTGFAPGCTIADTVVGVFETSDGTCATLNRIACNDDSCGLRSLVTATVNAGTTYYIQVAKYGTVAPTLGADKLSVYVTAPTPPPPTHTESGDAGDIPSTAQTAAGSGSLGRISGTITSGDADMYLINICDVATFSASTDGGFATFDTQLFLFNTNGTGVAFNDDSPLGSLQSRLSGAYVTAPGQYYLAISGYDKDPIDESAQDLWIDTPFGVERAPDGPGAANPIASWSATGAGGTYNLNLTGACFVGGPSCGSADFNGDGDVGTDADIEAFFACLAGNCCGSCGSADFNADGDTGTDSDIEAFFRVLAGGTC